MAASKIPITARPGAPPPPAPRRAAAPDLCITRHGAAPDAAVLELKATHSASSYLGAALSQPLGYLAERPEEWTSSPSGWLVAPTSSAFVAADPDGAELWIVSANDVAAAVARFASDQHANPPDLEVAARQASTRWPYTPSPATSTARISARASA